jgi:hypothetical protein
MRRAVGPSFSGQLTSGSRSVGRMVRTQATAFPCYDRRTEDLVVQICALRNCFHVVRGRSPAALAVRKLALHSFMVSTFASAATPRQGK